MRKNLILFLFIVSAFALSSTDCDKETESWCDTNKKPEIERVFIISADIQYQDIPYQGPVEFHINKEYCNGETAGLYSITHILPDESGYWFSSYQYKYKFANAKDFVEVSFGVTGYTPFVHYFRYSDVENMPYTIQYTHPILIPKDSP